MLRTALRVYSDLQANSDLAWRRVRRGPADLVSDLAAGYDACGEWWSRKIWRGARTPHAWHGEERRSATPDLGSERRRTSDLAATAALDLAAVSPSQMSAY